MPLSRSVSRICSWVAPASIAFSIFGKSRRICAPIDGGASLAASRSNAASAASTGLVFSGESVLLSAMKHRCASYESATRE